MKKLCMYLPPFAPDYSGVCSALFDFRVLLTIHDAAGCTGNYTGFDEPRWYGSQKAVYCSGLRKMDVVMGNEQKFLKRIETVAKGYSHDFIALVGSPVPMVIGTDFEGLCNELEIMTGIPAFGFHTTGTSYYNEGIASACIKVIERFAAGSPVKKNKTVNILGATPLDISEKNNSDMTAFLTENGWEVHADFSMGITLEKVKTAACACVNIAVSQAGLEIARFMEKRFGMPYVSGLPIGEKYGRIFLKNLEDVALHGPAAVLGQPAGRADTLVIGDAVVADSIGKALLYDFNKTGVEIRTPFGKTGGIGTGMELDCEQAVYDAVNDPGFRTVVADPMICSLVENKSEKTCIDIAHWAVSSKLRTQYEIPYISRNFNNIIEKRY